MSCWRCQALVAACPSGQTSSATSFTPKKSLRRTRTRQSWRTCTRASSTTSLAAAPSCLFTLGLDGQGDPRPRRFLAPLREVGRVELEGQRRSVTRELSPWRCAQGSQAPQACQPGGQQHWSRGRGCLEGCAADRHGAAISGATRLRSEGAVRGGVERWQVRSGRAPLWKSVSQGGRIFVWSATRRCCVLQLVVAGTPLQDRRTIQSTQPKSHHLSRTSWHQITHPSVIQRAPEHSCQQRLSSYNAWTLGTTSFSSLIVSASRTSRAQPVLFFCIVFCDRAGVFREHQVFAAAFAVCFRRYKSRLPLGCFSRHLCHMFVILTDILTPTSRVKFFNQRRTRFRVVTGSGRCWMPAREPFDIPCGATLMEASMFGVNVNKPCLDAGVD